jgi:hypothetical protein
MGKDFRVVQGGIWPIGKSQLGLSIEALNFLSDWWKTHIGGSDKKYGPFLNSRGLKAEVDDSPGVCRRNRKSFLLQAAEIIQPILKALGRLCPGGGIRGTSPFLTSGSFDLPPFQPEKPKPLF